MMPSCQGNLSSIADLFSTAACYGNPPLARIRPPVHNTRMSDQHTIPNVIESLDYETILERRKAAFIALWPAAEQPAWRDTLMLESEPVTKLLEESAYLELLLRTRINHAAASNLLAFAGDRDLDRLADFYGMARQGDEGDAAFRERIRERVRGSSTAGPAAHYRRHALSADPAVKDIYVDSPRAGEVRISVLPADNALVQKVRDHIFRDDIRVLTDSVTVMGAGIQRVDIEADIVLLPDAGSDNLDALAQTLRDAIATLGLGRDLTRSWIIGILQQPHVQSVQLKKPLRDITVDAHQYAQAAQITLTLKGRAY